MFYARKFKFMHFYGHNYSFPHFATATIATCFCENCFTNAIKDINKKKGKRIAVVINKLRTFPFVEGYALCHWSDQKNETLMWKSVLLYESVLFPRHLNVFATKSLTFQICVFYLNWLNHI